MPLEIKPRIVFQTANGSPIGRITLAGLLRNHTGVPEKPTRMLGSYALVYLLRGKGRFHDANGIRRQLVPGDLLTIFPDIPHWYGPAKGGVWDEFYIVFSGQVFDLWRAKGLLNAAQPLCHLEPVDYWLRRLEQVVVEEKDSLQQVCLLQRLLAEAVKASEVANEPPWLHRARTALTAGQNASPAAVARALGLSYETFRKHFTTATGASPSHYRLTQLIDRACALILAGGATNKEIAERLGFCDEFHFSHRFKQVVGLSPMAFRLKLPAKTEGRPGQKARKIRH